VQLLVYDSTLWSQIKATAEGSSQIVAIICYVSSRVTEPVPSSKPFMYHLSGTSKAQHIRKPEATIYEYPATSSRLFAFPGQKAFSHSSEAVSHTRNLGFVKKLIGGPYFDLEAIWEEHTYYEFENRSVAKTMGTMVQEPYVNHIPTVSSPHPTPRT
jgi:carboxymethylenebutenolidase